MKKVLLLMFLASQALFCLAQKTGSVSGILVDEKDRSVLEYATVSIFKAGDSVLTMYKLSDTKGQFKLNGLKTDTRYRLVVNAWQYDVLRKEFLLSLDNPDLSLDTLRLSKSTNTLDEVVVTGERPPVIVRKDTIEFNAEAFKTLPSAVVEDLLKKLPGVSIDESGNFLVNGKQVSRILVDGKEFFGGDQQMATKNLPANIIDKVQVTADKEALRRDPDLTDANTPQVINLKLKRAIKQGMFGKIYAGGGLNTRYEAGTILNMFRDTTQVSLLGYGNNLNRAGFSLGDVQRIGGFSRSGTSSMMVNSNGGFALDGISFGGTGSGIQESSGAGTNINTLTKKGVKLNLQYFFGQINSDLNQVVNNTQNLGTDELITTSNNLNLNRNFTHRASGRIDFKLDSLTNLNIRPSVTVTSLRGNRLNNKASNNGSGSRVNDSRNQQNQEQEKVDYNFFASYWKDFRKKGRSFNTSVEVVRADNTDNFFNYAQNNFYLVPSSSTLDQLRNTSITNFSVYVPVNYTEPLGKKLSLRLNGSTKYLDNENALFTWFRNPSSQAYDVAVPQFSETVKQSGWRSAATARLNWTPVKDLRISPGLVFNNISLQNEFVKYPGFTQNFSFFAPSLDLGYKFLNASYTPSFREPDVQYIQPVANNTDPLFVQLGNPDLQPSRSHQVYLSAYKYDTKRLLSFNMYLGGTIQDNAIVTSRTIDNNGVQTSKPVNVDGVWNFHTNGNLRKEFKNQKRQLTLSAGYYMNYNKDVVIVNSISSNSGRIQFGPNVSFRLNLNDKFEFNQRYSLGVNNSRYDDDFFRDINFYNHSSETELILRYPKKVVWETTFNMTVNDQQLPGFDTNIKLWNAAVTFLFMKNDRMQLKFSVSDILQSNVNRYRYITQNSIVDTQTNNLGRYGMLSLTYNIQNFGGKVGGKERFFGF